MTTAPGCSGRLEKLEALVRADPENLPATVGLAEAYRQMQKPDAALALLDKALDNPKLDANAALNLAQAYAALGNVPKLEAALEKLTKLMPGSPEAWYDLAALKASIGKTTEGSPTSAKH